MVDDSGICVSKLHKGHISEISAGFCRLKVPLSIVRSLAKYKPQLTQSLSNQEVSVSQRSKFMQDM